MALKTEKKRIKRNGASTLISPISFFFVLFRDMGIDVSFGFISGVKQAAVVAQI
jgi:hypothetical protein